MPFAQCGNRYQDAPLPSSPLVSELYDRPFVRPAMTLGDGLWKGGDGIRYGMLRPSPRTATGCLRARWPGSFPPRCCPKPGSKPCYRAIISRSTAPCWKPGRAPKAFTRKTAQAIRPGPGRTGEQDFHGEWRTNATRTPRPPIPTPVFLARGRLRAISLHRSDSLLVSAAVMARCGMTPSGWPHF
jgi:hypothetical protein